LFVEDGRMRAVPDTDTGNCWGCPSQRLATALADIGLRKNDEPSDTYVSRNSSQDAAGYC
jgi:hypothetical protein